MRKFLAGILMATVLSISFVLIVMAQSDEPLLARIAPLIINVQQDVPVSVEVAIPVDDEQTVTATIPMTLGIALQVNLSSALNAEIEVAENASIATIEVVEPAVTPLPKLSIGSGEDVMVNEVRWKLISAEDVGNTIKSNNEFIDDLTTSGRFIIVEFEMENQSSDQLTFVGIDLEDSKGRSYSASDDQYMYLNDGEVCLLENLNPNITKTCKAIYEVAENAEGLQIKFTDLEMFGGAEELYDLGLD